MNNELHSQKIASISDEWGNVSNYYNVHRLGHELYKLGFNIETDFKFGTAKVNGRLKFYRAAEYFALAKFPPAVRDALRDAPRDDTGRRTNGSDKICAQLPMGRMRTLTVTDWSKQIPGKIRDLAGCLRAYLIAEDLMENKPN